jgi:hypothetical protein
MATPSGDNEGVRVLDEFVCQANSLFQTSQPGGLGAGANAGIRVIAELAEDTSRPTMTDQRKADLRRLSTSDLLALVQGGGVKLTPADLRFIHDLAIERLVKCDDDGSKGADELSRCAMEVAVGRM